MALCLQGSLLVRNGPPAVADAFCASRLAGDGGLEYGTLPAGHRLRGHHRAQPPGRHSRRAAAQSAGPTIQLMPRRGNLQLARIFGIRVGASGSWLFVLFFLIYWLSKRFHEIIGGSTTTAYAIAVAGALGYFVSLVLHELGHALAARRLGIPVVGIDLWFFGGLLHMRRQPQSASEEFTVAAAGPLVTLGAVRCSASCSGSLFASGSQLQRRRPDPRRRHHHPGARPAGLAGVHQRSPAACSTSSPPSPSTAAGSRGRWSGGAPATATGPR